MRSTSALFSVNRSMPACSNQIEPMTIAMASEAVHYSSGKSMGVSGRKTRAVKFARESRCGNGTHC